MRTLCDTVGLSLLFLCPSSHPRAAVFGPSGPWAGGRKEGKGAGKRLRLLRCCGCKGQVFSMAETRLPALSCGGTGYFGDPHHWRVCSQGFHEESPLEAAISRPATASFSQGHPSAGPLPRGSLPGWPPAGSLQKPAPQAFGGTTRISMHFPRASGGCLSHYIRYLETFRSKFLPKSRGPFSSSPRGC